MISDKKPFRIIFLLFLTIRRVAKHEAVNTMNAKSLSVIWGEILFTDQLEYWEQIVERNEIIENLIEGYYSIFMK